MTFKLQDIVKFKRATWPSFDIYTVVGFDGDRVVMRTANDYYAWGCEADLELAPKPDVTITIPHDVAVEWAKRAGDHLTPRFIAIAEACAEALA